MGTIYNYEFVREKIQSELTDIEQSNNQNVKTIAKHVADKLIQFAENKIFGLKVQESVLTLTDCCKKILKGVNHHISDIEVYKRAAKFYFPSSDVEFTMNIIVSEQDKSSNGQRIDISLDDLF
ncbi:MAG: hypothetical protein JEZ08_24160 [Clostridiales bacterium]|nr:hypothetical protein [Clostridiales bacterium]